MKRILCIVLFVGISCFAWSQGKFQNFKKGYFVDIYAGAGYGGITINPMESNFPEPFILLKSPGMIIQPILGFDVGRWINSQINISLGTRFQNKGYLNNNDGGFHEISRYWMGIGRFEYFVLERLSYQLGISIGKGEPVSGRDHLWEWALLTNIKYYPTKNFAISFGFNKALTPFIKDGFSTMHNFSLDLGLHYRWNHVRVFAN
ncbi:MAG: hypothetical protein IPH93_04565 [Saprospiraceae bacterium]|nr:hypothetical protein [Saprospiraceae bacterium]MBK7811755.1 hypothetical protein [Saprospiraceae bacterium]